VASAQHEACRAGARGEPGNWSGSFAARVPPTTWTPTWSVRLEPARCHRGKALCAASPTSRE